MERKITAEQKEWEKKMERKSAVETGLVYFEAVIKSLERELEETKNYRAKWAGQVGKVSDNVDDRGDQNLANYILWNVHRVEQINLHSEKAVRAVGRISKAFNVEV